MNDLCGLCGFDEVSHEDFNHEFTLHDVLIPRKREKVEREPKLPPMMIVPAPDLELRLLLVQKGLLSEDDFHNDDHSDAGNSG